MLLYPVDFLLDIVALPTLWFSQYIADWKRLLVPTGAFFGIQHRRPSGPVFLTYNNLTFYAVIPQWAWEAFMSAVFFWGTADLRRQHGNRLLEGDDVILMGECS